MISYQAKTDGTLVTTQKNEYNGNGKRILKKDGNQEESYYYQNETLLLTVSDSQLKDFYYLGNVGNPLAVASKTSDGMKSYTYQKDVQGSTRAVTDTDGKCVEWYEYSDFGETTIHKEQAGFENVLCYTGGVYDESSGLYYLNARYYNPEMGRFISRDTYEGKNEEPSSLHLYLYCANDPVNYVDPSGHDAIALGASYYAVTAGVAAVGTTFLTATGIALVVVGVVGYVYKNHRRYVKVSTKRKGYNKTRVKGKNKAKNKRSLRVWGCRHIKK